VGVIGLFHFELQPSAAKVLMAITMKLRKRRPSNTGASGPSTELKGTLVVNVVQADSLGRELNQVASAQFTAEDFNGTLGVNYTDAFARLSSPVLLEIDKKYIFKL